MVRLEKFENTDYATLISWVDSEETLMQFAGPAFSFPLTSEQLDKSLNDINRYAFKAIEIQSKNMIGYGEIFLTEITAFLGRIIIGERKLRRQGFGLLMVNQLTDYAFTNLNQPKIELNVFEWNPPAINCYKKAGFVFNAGKKSERKTGKKTWIVLNMILER